MQSRKLPTGFKMKRVVGFIEEDETYMIIECPELDDDERCRRCKGHKGSSYCSEIKCRKNKYMLVNFNTESYYDECRFITIDINKLAMSCDSFCPFYSSNCYDTNKSCILRLLMNESMHIK